VVHGEHVTVAGIRANRGISILFVALEPRLAIFAYIGQSAPLCRAKRLMKIIFKKLDYRPLQSCGKITRIIKNYL